MYSFIFLHKHKQPYLLSFSALCDFSRSNYFEVFALDGANTNILQFCTAAESTDWLQAISTNINELTQENVSSYNNIQSWISDSANYFGI